MQHFSTSFFGFQSTHPLRGATPSPHSLPISSTDFNPRTPCGVRLFLLKSSLTRPGFQSTHPLRGATCLQSFFAIPCQFQSTHPLRGATSRRFCCRSSPRISIHAPLAGCDMLRDAVIVVSNRFQSTHPLRGATRRNRAASGHRRISIHAPLAGCDSLPLSSTSFAF